MARVEGGSKDSTPMDFHVHPFGARSRRRAAHGRRRARGVALIEFALVLPLLLVLTLCVIDVSRAFWIKNVAHQAAREGVRYLVVRSVADSAAVQARVAQVVGSAGVTLDDVDVVGEDANQLMEVHVTVEFNWLYPALFAWLGADYTNPVTLEAVAAMRKEG